MRLKLLNMDAVQKFVMKKVDKFAVCRETDCLSINLCMTLCFYAGIWTKKEEPLGLGPIARKCVSRVSLWFTLYTALIGMPFQIYSSWGRDLRLTVESVATFLVVLLLVQALLAFFYRTDEIGRIFEAFEEMNRWSAKLPKRPTDILERNKRWSDLTLGYFCAASGFTLGTFTRLPAAYENREFLYSAWFPFDKNASPYYELVYLSAVLHYLFAMTFLTGAANLLMALLVESIGQFRLLSHNLQKIHALQWTQRLVDADPPNHLAAPRSLQIVIRYLDECRRERDAPVACKPTEREVADRLEICVQHHGAIINFVDKIRSFFGLFLFLWLVCTLIPTGLAVVILIYSKGPVYESSTTLMYFFLVIAVNVVTAAICWLSDELKAESEAVREAVYSSDWFEASDSFKRSMRIIMSRSNQPVVVRVAGYIALSMETYHRITKLTYSFCMATWTYFTRNI